MLKSKLLTMLVVIAAMTFLPRDSFGAAAVPQPAEHAMAQRWTKASFGDAETISPPFSFSYRGQPSAELLPNWKRTAVARPLDNQRTEYSLGYADPESGLTVRCVGIQYGDFPVVEWSICFQNAGDVDTPLLENIQALDATWQRGAEGEFLLHHAVGSPAKKDDYRPLETPLGPAAVKRIAAAGGRPTNSDMAYFNLEWPGQGVIVVVGWPGQWAAEFRRDKGAEIRVRAGQERTRLKLLPGEEIRTPRMALLFWEGDFVRAQNLWRRWMMAHNMPRPGGQLPPPQFVASSSRAYNEMIGANEQNQIMHIDRYLEEGFKLDYWWMDAGWYVQQQGWPQVGTWEVDRRRFPRGLRPISDHAHAKGVKTLLWFEPERVMPGTWLYENHPEWLLRSTPGQKNTQAGMHAWSSRALGGSDPCVTYNPTAQVCTMADVRWEPGRLSFHPGPKGEYGVVRFTATEDGDHVVAAKFLAIDKRTTTEVLVVQRGKSVFQGWINLHEKDKEAANEGTLALAKGDAVDFVVGWGNGTHICDSTGLEARVKAPSGKTYDASRDFDAEHNPGGAWSYGYLRPAATPDSNTFSLFDRPVKPGETGPRLLDLGNPAPRQWLTEYVDTFLKAEGLDLYRQDFNIDPLAFWRAADAPDRQGIAENRYVCGYLAYWDELRRRHPNMLIDSCASGGRRNDLETMRRAVPLWRSDYAYEPIGHQCMTYGISFWLPYHGTGTVACANAGYYGGGKTPIEPYAFWSNATPSLGCGVDFRVRDIDYAALRGLVNDWRRIAPCYYGDYYPLTSYSQDNDAWIAWQFDCPEMGEGLVQVFRREKSDETDRRFPLRGIEPSVRYVVENLSDKSRLVLSGEDLLKAGLPVSLQNRPAAAVMHYWRETTGNR